MKYYAKYKFEQCELYPSSYILVDKLNKAENLHLAKYAESPKNTAAGISGKEYIHFGVPRNASMTKYFAHTFEGMRGKPITSTEALVDTPFGKRTFGDCFCLGYKDLILFDFSNDMKELVMYFLRDMGNSKSQKQYAFRNWCEGEKLIYD